MRNFVSFELLQSIKPANVSYITVFIIEKGFLSYFVT